MREPPESDPRRQLVLQRRQRPLRPPLHPPPPGPRLQPRLPRGAGGGVGVGNGISSRGGPLEIAMRLPLLVVLCALITAERPAPLPGQDSTAAAMSVLPPSLAQYPTWQQLTP